MDITGYRLRDLREKIGLSQREVAEKSEFETAVNEVNPRTHAQVKKYIGLTDSGKDIVDITLDAVYERERKNH